MSLSAKDLQQDEAWVVLVDDALAGFYRLSRANDRFEIEEFHLEPPMIGRGIGRRMFQHATERARAAGGRWLVWSTDSNALGFYLLMGGVITGTSRRASSVTSHSRACGCIFGRRDAGRGDVALLVDEGPRRQPRTILGDGQAATERRWVSSFDFDEGAPSVIVPCGYSRPSERRSITRGHRSGSA